MACKEATGSATCDACEGFGCQEDQGSPSNSSNSGNSNDANGSSVGATPPAPDLCIVDICAQGS